MSQDSFMLSIKARNHLSKMKNEPCFRQSVRFSFEMLDKKVTQIFQANEEAK